MNLSLTNRHWLLSDSANGDIVESLATQRGLADVLGNTPAKLSDPSRFPEMNRAVERIEHALAHKETIGIFGDYDADGITGAAQLVRFFRRHNVEPVVHLPHRSNEGYGLRSACLDELRAKGITLLITVDTGIAATKEVEHAAQIGMDVIVTDHHHAPNGRPPALAVIHPLIPTEFPNPNLSGSGVALMLVRALEHGKPWPGMEQDIILAAIGTIGDLVPLTGENRLLVSHALRLLQKLPDCPLKQFADEVRGTSSKVLNSTDIAFRVVPRINASGRIDHPNVALDALLHGGPSLAKLHELNVERQGMSARMIARAMELAKTDEPFVCVISEEFHPGIVGLVAGALTERFGRPSLAGAIHNGLCTASLRSIPEVHVTDLLSMPGVRESMLSFGGHAQAAGCTFNAGAFEHIARALSASMREAGHNLDTLSPRLRIDAELALTDVLPSFVESLQRLEPFGMGNAQPVFVLKGQSVEWVRTVGADNRHLQCRVGGKKAVGFGLGEHAATLAGKEWWDIACTLDMQEWNGKREVQMVIKDIRPMGKS